MSLSIPTTKSSLPVGEWTADQTHSFAGFAIRAVGTFRGSFESVTASLTVDEDGTARLVGSVAVASIHVKNEKLKAHLSSPDFFDVAHYPDIRFSADSITRDGETIEVDGDLTIRDQTRPINARGTITEPVTAIDGAVRLGLSLQTTIDRTDYGVSWNAPMPGGDTAIGNKVTITVDLDLVLAAIAA